MFYGYHPIGEPGDPNKLTSDPKLVAPGTAGTNNWSSLAGYKLQAGSPCIDSGTNLTNNGGLDFFGNAVPFNGITDRGANKYTVGGSTAPSISCPSNIITNTDSNLCSAVVTFSVTGGGSPPPTITCTPGSGSAFPTGTTTVNCVASNGVLPNATCSFTVTVNDLQPPTISSCAPPQTNSANGSCQAIVPDFTGGITASDNCTTANALTITQSPLAGTMVGVGTTIVTLTVQDTANNQATCQTTFTVSDTTPPSITCPATVIATEDPLGSGAAVVNYAAPTVSDNCSGVGTPVCTPASGASFPVGTNTVICVVADAAGNSNTCSFLVIVQKAANPAFRILSIQPQGNNLNVVWTTPGGRTNAVQATSGDVNGGYSTNFTDISSPIIVGPYGDSATNYVDVGGATNRPSRYYRVRLVP